jgi:hypothetical protein
LRSDFPAFIRSATVAVPLSENAARFFGKTADWAIHRPFRTTGRRTLGHFLVRAPKGPFRPVLELRYTKGETYYVN